MPLKRILKKILLKTKILKIFLIKLYKIRGQKPWSLGYSVAKFSFIGDIVNTNLKIFSGHRLPSGYGVGFDERVVEYPWVFSRLKKSDMTILDAGSSLNHPDILNLPLLSNRELTLVTLADEGRFPTRTKVIYSYQDLRHLDVRDEFFDAIICISTLEHVGMDNTFLYTTDDAKKENDAQGYLTAVQEFKRVLKGGGTLYLTMPFGKHRNHGWFQVFDGRMVTKLMAEFSGQKSEKVFFKYTSHGWKYAKEEDCLESRYFDVHDTKRDTSSGPAASESVICLELVK